MKSPKRWIFVGEGAPSFRALCEKVGTTDACAMRGEKLGLNFLDEVLARNVVFFDREKHP